MWELNGNSFSGKEPFFEEGGGEHSISLSTIKISAFFEKEKHNSCGIVQNNKDEHFAKNVL
jgi:hypothetical protein